MKILQVCPRYYPSIGGVEEHVRNISERLAEKFDVSVFTTDHSGELPTKEIINGVKVRRFKSWAPNEAYFFSKELKRYLLKDSSNYDVVHAHSYHAFPALYAALSKSNNKFIFTPHYHGAGHTFFRGLFHIPYKFFGKTIFEKAEKIICVSNYERSLILDHFKIDDEKVLVIPNGVDLEKFEILRKNRKDCRVILSVGRLEKYKGIQYLIRVLPKLASDIVLEIVGKGSYKQELARLSRKLGVESRTFFFQYLSRKKLVKKYVDANLFVLLSKREAYGISVAEALASKTPCIVANISALYEWIDSKNCFGINYPIDLDELVKLINKVIGREISEIELYDWDDVVSELSIVYEEL